MYHLIKKIKGNEGEEILALILENTINELFTSSQLIRARLMIQLAAGCVNSYNLPLSLSI